MRSRVGAKGPLDLRGSRREVTGERSGGGANVDVAAIANANAKANADDGGQRVPPSPESEKSG